MLKLDEMIGIGITTRDRWDDLDLTLSKLKEFGYDSLETVVIDDGSLLPVPLGLSDRFPNVRFIRSDTSLGLIAQRNRLSRLLISPLMLGLDDDSHPIEGNLLEAAAWMISHPKVVALAFSVKLPDSLITDLSPDREPYPVRDYIGCGNLINLPLFNALHGYDERLNFFNEEAEFCLRVIQAGYEIHAYPSVVIHHLVSSTGRNFAPRARKFVRNEMLLALWYFPITECFLRSIRILPAILLKNSEWRNYAFELALGYLEAPLRYLTWPKIRKRFSAKEYHDWKALPCATEALSESINSTKL